MIKKSVVTIVNSLGTPCGAGFFMSDKLILTTIPVVNRAINREPDRHQRPKDIVEIDFVYPAFAVGEKASASILSWKSHGQAIKLVLLKLRGETPAEIRPISLLDRESEEEHIANMVTFPFANAHESWVFGTISSIGFGQTYHFEHHQRLSPHPNKQFSGAPVWDDDFFGVGGIFVAGEDVGSLGNDTVIRSRTILDSFHAVKIPHTVHPSARNALTRRNRPNSLLRPRLNHATQSIQSEWGRLFFWFIVFIGCSWFFLNGQTIERNQHRELMTTAQAVSNQLQEDQARRATIIASRPTITPTATIPLYDFNAVFSAGQTTLEQDDNAEAIRLFSQAISLDPESASSFEHLATAYAKGFDFANAHYFYEQAAALQPPSNQFRDSRGLTYFVSGNYAQAIEFLDGSELTPRTTEALGLSYLNSNQFSEAESVFLSGISAFPDGEASHLRRYLAQTYVATQQFGHAMTQYKLYLEEHPTNHVVYCEWLNVIWIGQNAEVTFSEAELILDLPQETLNQAENHCPTLLSNHQG